MSDEETNLAHGDEEHSVHIKRTKPRRRSSVWLRHVDSFVVSVTISDVIGRLMRPGLKKTVGKCDAEPFFKSTNRTAAEKQQQQHEGAGLYT